LFVSDEALQLNSTENPVFCKLRHPKTGRKKQHHIDSIIQKLQKYCLFTPTLGFYSAFILDTLKDF
jgi:hypothetical protein